MITRDAGQELAELAKQFKAVALIGPRQSGKTTLAKAVFPEKQYVSLENPDLRRFALDDPRGFLSQYPDGAILDEIQRAPELFSYLQQILDEESRPGIFILTGSNNFLLQENISQSLAGRVSYLYLLPFTYSELPADMESDLPSLILKGLYPPIYDQKADPGRWYRNYIRTYLERDVRQIKNITDIDAFERFLRLCAGRTGQILNMQNLAIQAGVDGKTIASWISVLEQSFIIFRLKPHHKNYNKRLVKMPKLYFYDTGLVCTLLGIQNPDQLKYHPLYGSIFESLIVSELTKQRFNKGQDSNLFFWRDNTGHEIDVLIDQGEQLYPVEIKSGQTITTDFFRGLNFWEKITGQPGGAIIYAGNSLQTRSNGVRIIPWDSPLDELPMR
ncbi:MAG: ATP-binding protein [Bacteroidota bacterium]|nr:ATP-binding protein [Bacteroidota bacterium]